MSDGVRCSSGIRLELPCLGELNYGEGKHTSMG